MIVMWLEMRGSGWLLRALVVPLARSGPALSAQDPPHRGLEIVAGATAQLELSFDVPVDLDAAGPEPLALASSETARSH